MNQYLIEVPTLGDLLLRAGETWPERDAVVFPDSRATYGELTAKSYERARSLIAMGVKRGDHVGLLMPNCPEYIELIFAVALVGAVSVPVNARYKARELAYVIDDADITVLLTTDLISEYADFAELLSAALPGLAESTDPLTLTLASAPKLNCVVMMGDSRPAGFVPKAGFEALSREATEQAVDARRVLVRLRDTCMLNYTSGTTANPKGCVLTHEAVACNGITINRARWHFTEQDRLWNPLPTFHMALFMPLLACFECGAALITETHFEPGASLAYMEREKVTALFTNFPTLTVALINHPEFENFDASRIRWTTNVAPPDVLRQFQEVFPNSVQVSAFGLAECSGYVATHDVDDPLEDRMETCGKPLPGVEVRIVDPETGNERAPCERGEITVRGYNMLERYYKDPEKTAATLRDGWVYTGDLGSMTQTGHLCFHGRLKDMLKVGGENVAAIEIESFLSGHPAAKMVQVIGVADERLEEVPAAFIELKPGATAEPEEFAAMCKGEIASFKIPRYVQFVTDWPMSATKIQKTKLAELPLGEKLV